MTDDPAVLFRTCCIFRSSIIRPVDDCNQVRNEGAISVTSTGEVKMSPSFIHGLFEGVSTLDLISVKFITKFCAQLNAQEVLGSCHKRQKPQAPTPQAPVRNRQTRKVANAKVLYRNTNPT